MAHAVACEKPIIILQDEFFVVTEVPVAWKEFEMLLTGPRTLVYNSIFEIEGASHLKDIRSNPLKNAENFYKPEDIGKNGNTIFM